jgi:hypothetical protein
MHWRGTENQGDLHEEVKATFLLAEKDAWKDVSWESLHQVEKGHGRLEKRDYWTISSPLHLGLPRSREALEGVFWDWDGSSTALHRPRGQFGNALFSVEFLLGEHLCLCCSKSLGS